MTRLTPELIEYAFKIQIIDEVLKNRKRKIMTPTLPDEYGQLRSSGFFRPINSKRDKLEELKNKINDFLDKKGIVNKEVRLELIKMIIEDEEGFE